jgi:magnesium-transporting ATPase (P-type)
MPGEPSDFDPQRLWQSQVKEYDPMTLADIHRKARTLESKVRRRNALEYVGCVLVIAGFLPAVLHRGSWMMQVGGTLIIAATGFIAWQLHRRGSATAVAESGDALVDAYRRELMRQRDALRSIAVWYLAPFVPGMTLLLLGRWFQSHATRRPIALDHIIIALTGVIAALVFLVIWLLNQRGADRLQRRIEEL